MDSTAETRLAELLERGAGELAPLWIEQLPPDRALAEAAGRDGPAFRLGAAHRLLAAGRSGEAAELLAGLGDLPAGLRRVADRLTRQVPATMRRPEEPVAQEPAAPQATSGLASETLAELYARQGDVESAVATYREILVAQPDHQGARGRLRDLLGKGTPSDATASLGAWLMRVRKWRRALHV